MCSCHGISVCPPRAPTAAREGGGRGGQQGPRSGQTLGSRPRAPALSSPSIQCTGYAGPRRWTRRPPAAPAETGLLTPLACAWRTARAHLARRVCWHALRALPVPGAPSLTLWLLPPQLLRHRPHCWPRLHQPRAHPWRLRPVRRGPLWLHLAGAEVLQPVQPRPGRLPERRCALAPGLRGDAQEHPVPHVLTALPLRAGLVRPASCRKQHALGHAAFHQDVRFLVGLRPARDTLCIACNISCTLLVVVKGTLSM